MTPTTKENLGVDDLGRETTSEGDSSGSPQRALLKPEQVGAGDRLAQIKARLVDVPPGPWGTERDGRYGYRVTPANWPEAMSDEVCEVDGYGNRTTEECGVLAGAIASWREDVPYLLAEVERLREVAEAWARFAGHISECERCEGGMSECLRRDTLWEAAQRLSRPSPSTTYTEGRTQGDVGVPSPNGAGGPSLRSQATSEPVPNASNPTTEAKGTQ